MLTEYFSVLIFVGVGVLFGLIPLILGALLGPRNPYPNKTAAFECGFPAFEDARMPFDVRFYLVAILFIVFDLETAFLFPWGVVLREIGWLGFFSMVFFLLVLVVGFIYEWKMGALEWE